MSKPKLTYFGFPGRAEPIRLAFYIGGIDYENETLDFPAFGAKKAAGAFPLGSVPVLELNGEQFCQSNALLRYAGRLTNLYPTEPVEALRVDQVLDTCEEMMAHVAPTIRTQDDAERKRMREDLLANVFPKYEKALNKWSEAGNVVPGKFTIGDLAIFAVTTFLTSGRLDHIPVEYFKNACPNCVTLAEKVKENPKVQEYYANKK
jgi:glutathione S-transferase